MPCLILDQQLDSVGTTTNSPRTPPFVFCLEPSVLSAGLLALDWSLDTLW